MKKIFNPRFFSRTAIVIVLLALIRTITQFFLLDDQFGKDLSISMLKPYMLAALLCASAAFVMVVLNFFHRYYLVIIGGVLTVAALIYIAVTML